MITLYSKTVCPYCVNAKAWLDQHGFQYQVIDIEKDSQAREFIMSQGHRTVPQIYLHGKILVEGGWTGLSKTDAHELREEIELRQSLSSGTI